METTILPDYPHFGNAYHESVMYMRDIRCPYCATPHRPGQLLLKAVIVKGEIKCPRCGKIVKMDYTETEPNSRTDK